MGVNESGARFRIPDGYHVDTPELPKTDTQRQFIEFQRQHELRGVDGTGKSFTPESYSNHSDVPYLKVRSEKVVYALNNFESKKWIFGNENSLLDKSGIKH